MALVKKRSNSARTLLIGAVVLVVGVIGYFLFQQFFINKDEQTLTNTVTERTKAVRTNFGEEILQDPRYRALVPFGTTPIPPSGTNPNPFQ